MVHERIMRGLWEAHEWENQGLLRTSKLPEKIKIIFTILLNIGNKWGGSPFQLSDMYYFVYLIDLLGLTVHWLCAHCSMLSSETQGRIWIRVKIDTIRANGHAKLTVYELFMRGSWEVYEWLMSRRRVANAAQPLILDFFTSFNYQHICRIICFGFNTFTRNS